LRLEVELLDLDMRRQRVALDRVDVLQAREIVAELAADERRQQPALQIVCRHRRVQRQRGVQMHRARRIGGAAVVERVEQTMRFADAQWGGQMQRAVDVGEEGVDRVFETVQTQGRRRGGVGHGRIIAKKRAVVPIRIKKAPSPVAGNGTRRPRLRRASPVPAVDRRDAARGLTASITGVI
jgi:hypothetical protein